MNPEQGPGGPPPDRKGKSASNAERAAYYGDLLNSFKRPETTQADKLAYYRRELGNDNIGAQATPDLSETADPLSGPEASAQPPLTGEAIQEGAPDTIRSTETREHNSEGPSLLAASFERIAAETGPEGVQAYVESLLAPEAAETAPQPERAALFELLAKAQHDRIREQAMQAGQGVDRQAAQRQGMASDELLRSELQAKRTIDTFGSQYDAMRRGQAVNGRVLANRTEDIGDQMNLFMRGTHDRYQARLDTEIRAQDRDLRDATTVLNDLRTHELALGQAIETVQPDYDGEPRPIALAIDADILKGVVAELTADIQAAREAGRDPSEAVAAMQGAPERFGEGTVQGQLDRLHARHAELSDARRELATELAQMTQAVTVFRRSAEAYRGMRDTSELAAIGGRQTTALRTLNAGMRRLTAARQRIFQFS